MLEEIKNVYRYKLYEECRVLVIDLTDVISELKIFLEKKFYPFVKESGKRIFISGIEVVYENDNIVWRIFDRDDIDVENIIRLNQYNIEEHIPGKEEYIIEVKETFKNYPKVFYGMNLLCFTDTLDKFLYTDELIIEPCNVFDICELFNNGENNIIYEIKEG